MRDTIDSTDTLRGIAILSVVINHYLNRNISGDFLGFATVWLRLFFIVSGFGIYRSLEKLLIINTHIELKNIAKFYYLRIVRIFPLFWISYIVQQLLLNQEIYLFSLLGIHGSGHFWFIPAILQCYIISPLIFLLIYYNRIAALFLFLIVYVSFNIFINLQITPVAFLQLLNYLHLNWNNTYFLYILIFSLSMLLPNCIENWGDICQLEKNIYLCLLLLLTLFFMISVKWRDELTLFYDLFVITLIPVILMATSSIYLLFNGLYFNLLSWLGRRSYPIFLFHIAYFLLINIIFQYRRDSVEELIIALILFPLFLIVCTVIEHLDNRLSAFLKSLIVSRPTIK